MTEPGKTAGGLLVVRIETEPEYAAELNRWYDEEHIPERLGMPGFRSARRYQLDGGSPTYLAVYDLDEPGAATSEQYMSQQPTPWMRRLRPHWRSMERSVWAALPAGSIQRAGSDRSAGR
jgi:hypothetical protein